jgi:hypothetical protein
LRALSGLADQTHRHPRTTHDNHRDEQRHNQTPQRDRAHRWGCDEVSEESHTSDRQSNPKQRQDLIKTAEPKATLVQSKGSADPKLGYNYYNAQPYNTIPSRGGIRQVVAEGDSYW